MECIKEPYGEGSGDRLKLTEEQYRSLEPFLKGLGIRSRMTEWCGDTIVIQAENVYISEVPFERRWVCENQLTDFSISCYKR